MASPMTALASVARFVLDADELHLVQDRVRSIVLPAVFRQAWNAETTGGEIAEREARALTALVERGFIDADVPRDPMPADLSEWVIGAAGTFLSLHMAPALVFEVSSWTRQSTTLMVASVRRGFASILARGQSVTVSGARASVADRVAVEFAVVPVERLAGEIALAIPPGGAVGAQGAPVRYGLAAARGAIQAIRLNDARVMAAAAERVGGAESLAALRSLAGSFDAGFELRVVRGDGRPVSMLNYLRGDQGWVSLVVGLPRVSAGVPTPDDIVDAASMTVMPVTTRGIGTALVSIVAGLLKAQSDG